MKTKRRRYLERLKDLVDTHTGKRRLRFLPFYAVLFKAERGIPPEGCNYRESLAIVFYAFSNAVFWGRQDNEFLRVLKNATREEEEVDYFDYMGKTPLPMQDYLKVNYDMRKVFKG